MVNNKEFVAFVIPTGIGASIGGYAGDASVYARKLSKKIPLIVNPNVVNAAAFSGINENMLYVEGWALTECPAGQEKNILSDGCHYCEPGTIGKGGNKNCEKCGKIEI